VELYLFDTGVVCLVYELSLPSTARLDSIIEFNYAVQNQSHNQAQVASTGVNTVVTFDGLSREILPAGTKLMSLNDRNYKFQTLVKLERQADLDACADELFHLRRGTKHSYELAVRGSGDGELLRPFGNISIGVTFEAVCMAIVDTGHPFLDELPDRFRTSYFAHYLLALHQRAAVLAIGEDVARIPAQWSGDPAPELLGTLVDSRVLITRFNLRHRFAVVSSHTNYSNVYAALLRALSVQLLVDELRDKVSDADELIRRLAASAEERHRLRSESARADQTDREARRDRIFGRFVAIIGPTSLLLMLYATHFYREGIHLNTPAGWLPIVVAAVVTALLLMTLRSPRG